MNHHSIIKQHSTRLDPIDPGVTPRITPLSGVAAVLFDIYGTLIISSSGDVESDPSLDRPQAFVDSLAAVFEKGPGKIDAEIAIQIFDAAIAARHEELRESGTEFPEVDIRDIWQTVWHEFHRREWIESTDPFVNATEQFAVEFESRVNPVWPMPKAKETIETLASTKKLGIISNAQFITPELFPALLGKSISELGFADSLLFYSFKFEQAKPGVQLYELAVSSLEDFHIPPDKVLYVGNDMLKDIMPAQSVGFKTALFAGDQRSLRMRSNNPHVSGTIPDVVVTHLDQIPTILE